MTALGEEKVLETTSILNISTSWPLVVTRPVFTHGPLGPGPRAAKFSGAAY